MRFEFRLQNGNKLFPIGVGWHDVLGEGGAARIRECPGFCCDLPFADIFAAHAKASWSFWRMGDVARLYLLDRASLCAPVTVTDATPGAGFISIDHLANERKELKVDVCLSVTQTVESGVSVFDDWNRIAKAAKNDLHTEILLRLNLATAAIRDFDLDGFVAGKRLGTTDLELEVRPSAIQFSPDD
ncbi:MAG TPA: hypothetical protein VF340_01115 [Methyloceanibacter sp.]